MISPSSARIEVSTDSVAQLALSLRHLADCLEEWCCRAAAEPVVLTPSHHLHDIRWRVCRIERDLRADADSTASVALSYLGHDSAARVAFMNQWTGWGGWMSTQDIVTASLGPAGGGVLWLGTALSAVWAFSHPTSLSVSTFRSLATHLGNAVSWTGSGGRGGSVGVAATGPTAELAASMGRILAVVPSVSSAQASTPAAGMPSGHVSVTRMGTQECRPARSFVEVVSRVPEARAGGPQVRVDRTPSETVVYIAGTVSNDYGGGTEPWDMSSNVVALGGDNSDAVRGTRAALTAAGVTSSDRLILVGHSQGGLVAQRLASDPSLAVSDVITIGAPVQPEGMPEHVRFITLENSSDPIPSLGGEAALGGRDLSVRRIDDIPAHGDGLAGHHLRAYAATAFAMDDSNSPILRQTAAVLFADDPSRTCTTTFWRAERSG